MCGRYVQAKTVAEVAEAFDATPATGEEPAPPPSWNVAPTRVVPIVLARPEPRVRQVRLLRWGLVPSWAKDPAIGSRMINARAETLATKPAFRRALSVRRCLVPADGWYEWQQLEPGPDGKARKQPVYFTAADAGQLAFAGLYEHWRADADSPWLSTFTVVTTTAVDEHGHVHDRSPVPLPRADWAAWLDPEVTEADEVVPLLAAPRPGEIVATPVPTRVNAVRNDGPELIEPLPLE